MLAALGGVGTELGIGNKQIIWLTANSNRSGEIISSHSLREARLSFAALGTAQSQLVLHISYIAYIPYNLKCSVFVPYFPVVCHLFPTFCFSLNYIFSKVS